MKKIMALFFLSIACLAGEIIVQDAFIKATAPNAKNSAIFMTITNNSNKDVNLISASSNLSQGVEIHTHKEENSIKKMVKLSHLNIPANSKVELKPGGAHIMLFGVKPITSDTKANLTLNFDDNTKVEVKNIEVKQMKVHHH